MRNVEIILLRLGAAYLLIGLLGDLVLHGTSFDLLRNADGHFYSIGFGLHTAFALFYKQWPQLRETRLARIHVLLFVVGAPMLTAGLACPVKSSMNDGVVLGGLLVLFATIAFALNLFSADAKA